DLDRFKDTNDTLGHLAGDQMLLEISRRVRHNLPDGAGLGRFGGDEFAILVENLQQPSEAEEIARRLLRSLDVPFQVNGREIYCSASIGIATWNSSCTSVEDLLRDADTAMYSAKGRGGGECAVFDEAMRKSAAARLEIENGLRKAIDRKELHVYYQPKICLDSGVLVGFEALLRWQRPDLGVVSPADFISVAEATGQIVAIGEWAIREACRQMMAWQSQFSQVPPLRISVNLSVRQFRQPDIAGRIARILEETGLAPEHLQLEITESVLMEDPDNAIVTARKLKDLGVGIKLDDFGTGYSSLSYLCRMPIDTLKIDRSFIVRMKENNTDLEVVRTVIALARSLGLEVVAEGVECGDQVAQLRALGCQFGQGYYFGRPINASETTLLLQHTRDDGTPDNSA
ncbi:MAG: bifunctional diguanylate cyclase/phosphodiesterase, partial [Bryobacterales bacterium]|nr:bifunctional diguanylate cyclase/phosphodiesterase [Bryobacterales bacterium]